MKSNLNKTWNLQKNFIFNQFQNDYQKKKNY